MPDELITFVIEGVDERNGNVTAETFLAKIRQFVTTLYSFERIRRKRQAIDDLLSGNKEKRNRICTSVITHIEVIPKKLERSKEEIYWEKFQSMYFYDIEVDRNVIILAREIKNYYFSRGDPIRGDIYKMLSTGDAFHLATAIIHQANEFHTRDKKPKGGNIPLLGLPESSPNGKICGTHNLHVLSPEISQGRLDGI